MTRSKDASANGRFRASPGTSSAGTPAEREHDRGARHEERDERDSAATADLEHPNVPWQSKGADKAGYFERLLASVASFLIWKRLVLAVAGRY